MKKVSILVRTCNRPAILKNCLQSIRDQDYENIEVVVVEDGEAKACEMINNDFSDMDIHYYATGKHIGRAKVGNIALSKATGEFFNFLDDDDEFYFNHVSSLIDTINKNSCKVAYSLAEESVCHFNKKKQSYFEIYKFVRYKNDFNKLYLLHENYFPIQTVMFSRELFEKLGGFREDVEYLEDWELWVRYAMKENFYKLNMITSKYRVPVKSSNRNKKLRESYPEIYEGFLKYNVEYNVGNLHKDLNSLLREYYMPLWKKIILKVTKPLRKLR